MNLYLKTNKNKDNSPSAIIIFGLGLIGKSIHRTILLKKNYQLDSCEKIDWNSSDGAKSSLDKVLDLLVEKNIFQISIIWSAGKAGFHANEIETESELNSFQTCIKLLGKYHTNYDIQYNFILISSAGGLYENCINVTKHTDISPSRAYGYLKLNQEKILQNSKFIKHRQIFRLSSIFGNINENSRLGLIPTMILNGLKQQNVQLTGNLSTLRDYLFADNASEYIYKKINYPEQLPEEKIYILASGKPTSIFELKIMIEKLLKRKIYLNFTLNQSNFKDITFSQNILPEDWITEDLNLSIAKIHKNWLNNVS
jgi:dTDP-D-glucose 4,6-dehydratase